MSRSQPRRFFRQVATYVVIVGGTLLLLDLTCIALGLFPPNPSFGHPQLGWLPAVGTDAMQHVRCIEFSTNDTLAYQRNEDGVRTSRSRAVLAQDTAGLLVVAVGDSQTDLCAPNSATHFGVLETTLRARGTPAVAVGYAAGRYSPLQAYLAFRAVPREYGPDVLVLNFYTGNDFYDLLRVDDRPHFQATDTGYQLADPVWFLYDDPGKRPRSRVLWAVRGVQVKLGVRGLLVRLRQLRHLAGEFGEGFSTVWAYMNDLRKAREPSIGYPAAFTAQMLNQQLFFHHFAAAQGESVRRARALLELIRRENPDMLLVISPIPSYLLVGDTSDDQALRRTVDRLPITNESARRAEEGLYDTLRALAADEGWVFVETLAPLRAFAGPDRLYNDFDYHVLPAASAIIGNAQAAALLAALPGGTP
jgi:hypothetical protein